MGIRCNVTYVWYLGPTSKGMQPYHAVWEKDALPRESNLIHLPMQGFNNPSLSSVIFHLRSTVPISSLSVASRSVMSREDSKVIAPLGGVRVDRFGCRAVIVRLRSVYVLVTIGWSSAVNLNGRLSYFAVAAQDEGYRTLPRCAYQRVRWTQLSHKSRSYAVNAGDANPRGFNK